ncbi:DUF5803 family protein [Halodesulfurarchaeum sp.]|uniref:DUF5803 family protein n=1 Tax=Halodesulfurarchaeum sp. TaxID=1980530 RepID=UPI002FC3ABC2
MRRILVVVALAGLLVLAGCLGGGVVEEAKLTESATYDWDTSADTSVNITGGSYQAVLRLENRTNVSLFGPGEFGGEAALPVQAVKYRYPNGTVRNVSVLSVSEQDERTLIETPVAGGQVAYTAQVRSSDLYLPVAVNGSHSVTLPPGAEVGLPIIGGATPSGSDITRSDERIMLTWSNPDSHIITIDYYQERNLYIFGGLLGIAAVIAGAGLVYFRAQLRSLTARRGEMSPQEERE